jgi:hypothetical protein
MSWLIKQREDKPVKGELLFGGQQINVAFVIQQIGGDSEDGPSQVAGPGNTVLDLVGPFVDQGVQIVQVYVHISCSCRVDVRPCAWFCSGFGVTVLYTNMAGTSTTNETMSDRPGRDNPEILSVTFPR